MLHPTKMLPHPVAELQPATDMIVVAVDFPDAVSAWPDPVVDLPVETPVGDSHADRLPRRSSLASRNSKGWLLPLLVFPLILYSILATLAVALLWNRLQQAPPHPLEMFPDVEGDTPGVQKNGKKSPQIKAQIAPENIKKWADAPLPGHLRVSLGETFRIGDLEVTPRRVERGIVRVFVDGYPKPEPCPHESLVLHLRLRNVSADSTFTPTDNYFDRNWKQGRGVPPLTMLELGSRRFYGGPAEWRPRGTTANARRQWVEGRKDFDERGLEPGGEMDTFVCTDGGDPKVMQAFEQFHGKLLWRVQLRRGVVQFGNREVPAAAVIGVEFTDRDVAHARAG